MTAIANQRMSPLRRDFHALVARVHQHITPKFAALTGYRPGMHHWRKHELKNHWGEYTAGRWGIVLAHGLVIPLVKAICAIEIVRAYCLNHDISSNPKTLLLIYAAVTALKAGMVTLHENAASGTYASAGNNAHRFGYNFVKHFMRPF